MDNHIDIKKQNITIISKNNNLIGEFHLTGIIQIASNISGKIFVDKDGIITLDRTASFKGEINCHDIEIFGNFEGILKSEGRVSIRSSSNIKGQIDAKSINIYPGAVVNIEGHTTTL